MSGSTPAQERDEQLLSIGHQCSSKTCGLVDFLPFKCQHCSLPFCAEHYLPNAHSCEKYDETKFNRVAPSCACNSFSCLGDGVLNRGETMTGPLCNDVISIPPGEDPNIRMERHFTTDCTIMTGKPKAKSKPTCANTKCRKVLISPISCDVRYLALYIFRTVTKLSAQKCKHQFCPQHRFPNTHNCAALSNPSSSKPTNTFSASATNISSQTSAATMSAMAAIKRSLASGPSSSASKAAATARAGAKTLVPVAIASRSTSGSSGSSSSGMTNPFSKTDRYVLSFTFMLCDLS